MLGRSRNGCTVDYVTQQPISLKQCNKIVSCTYLSSVSIILDGALQVMGFVYNCEHSEIYHTISV